MEKLYLDILAPLNEEILANKITKNFNAKPPALPTADLRRHILLTLKSKDEDEGEGNDYVSTTPFTSFQNEDMTLVNENICPELTDI